MTLLQDLEKEARGKYQNVTPGFAYVFQHNAQKGLRLEVPDIVLEYSNGVLFGRDPRGLFYYHGLSDLDNSDMRYQVEIKRREQGGATKEEVLVINFWTKDDSPTSKPYAQFIAGVPVRAWGQTQPGSVVGGRWGPLDVLQATSVAKSRGNQALVSLTMNSLKKKFEFDIPADQVEGSTINCHGSLIVRDFAQLTGSNLYVDYTNTRIMIYKQQNDTYPIAVFSPLELYNDQPLVDKSFEVKNGRFSNF